MHTNGAFPFSCTTTCLKEKCDCAFKKVTAGCGLLVIRFPDQYDFSVQTAKGASFGLELVAAALCAGSVMGTLVWSMFIRVGLVGQV